MVYLGDYTHPAYIVRTLVEFDTVNDGPSGVFDFKKLYLFL